MRARFKFAKTKAVELNNTSILFIDECDGLFRKSSRNDPESTVNITRIFQECMNGILEPKGQVVVLAATNYREMLPPAILSRFQYKIEVKLPDKHERVEITKLQIRKRTKKDLRTDMTEADFNSLAEETEGASGRDLEMLVKNTLQVRRTFTKNHDGWWCKDDAGNFVPCNHTDRVSCGAELFSYARRPGKVKNEPLSLKHFRESIDKFGVSPQFQEEQKGVITEKVEESKIYSSSKM